MNDAAEAIDGVFTAKPRLALTVGFTGHRELAGDAGRWLGPALVDILGQLARELADEQKRSAHAFSEERPVLRMISGLAAGADTIAAHAAIAAHVELDVILPFARDEFANDFKSDIEKTDLNILISQACEIVELPGTRAEQSAAYEQVGVAMLSHADLIIAVWNSKVARGRGGTAEVVAHAVERTIPVIHVPPEERAVPSIIWSGLEGLPLARPTAWTTPQAAFESRIGDVVRTLVAPPQRDEDDIDLEAVLARPPRRTRWLSLAWPLMLTATLVRGIRRIDVVSPRPSALLAKAAALLPVTDANFRDRIEEHLLTLGARADALATQFGQMHRSSFVLNFALAAFAVAFAIAGVPRGGAYQAWVAPLELAALLAIVVNTWLGLRGKWHEKWLELRHLAERCRVLAMALPLGEPLLRFENSERAGGVPDWVRWRSRAAVRAAGMPTLLIDDAQVAAMRARLIAEIDGQRDYHADQAHRMHRLDHRTHLIGLGLFGLSLAASLLHCAVLLYEWQTHHHIEAEWFADTVLFVTAVAPAAGAAIYGIRVLGEFAGIARQSHVMVDQFEGLMATVTADPPDYRLVTDRMRRLASIMLRETADWRLTFESRPFGLPS